MFTVKNYIYRYNRKPPVYGGASKLMAHNGMNCKAIIHDPFNEGDTVYIQFEDGFDSYAYMHELLEIGEVM